LLAHDIYTIVTAPIAAHPCSLVSPLLRSLLLRSFSLSLSLSLSLFSPCSLVLGGFFFGSRCGLLTTVDCCTEKIPLPIQMLKIFAKTSFFFGGCCCCWNFDFVGGWVGGEKSAAPPTNSQSSFLPMLHMIFQRSVLLLLLLFFFFFFGVFVFLFGFSQNLH